MKKSRFLTFIFALIPGAGQMYLGLMTKGVVLMSLFFAINILVATSYSHAVLMLSMVAVIVLWFYSFFDALNYNSKPYETETYVDTRTSYAEEPFEKTQNIQ